MKRGLIALFVLTVLLSSGIAMAALSNLQIMENDAFYITHDFKYDSIKEQGGIFTASMMGPMGLSLLYWDKNKDIVKLDNSVLGIGTIIERNAVIKFFNVADSEGKVVHAAAPLTIKATTVAKPTTTPKVTLPTQTTPKPLAAPAATKTPAKTPAPIVKPDAVKAIVVAAHDKCAPQKKTPTGAIVPVNFYFTGNKLVSIDGMFTEDQKKCFIAEVTAACKSSGVCIDRAVGMWPLEAGSINLADVRDKICGKFLAKDQSKEECVSNILYHLCFTDNFLTYENLEKCRIDGSKKVDALSNPNTADKDNCKNILKVGIRDVSIQQLRDVRIKSMADCRKRYPDLAYSTIGKWIVDLFA